MTELTRITENTKPILLDLNTHPLLFRGEEPEDIIGFSMIIRGSFDKVHKAKRVDFKNSKKCIRDEVKSLVNYLRDDPDKGDFIDPKILSYDQFSQLNEYLEKSSLRSDKTDKADLPAIYWVDNRQLKLEKRKPLLEINKPTLLVFTTNTEAIKVSYDFVGKVVVPKNPPSTELDPNCANLRFWEEGAIMAMYSDYKHSRRTSKSEYWYNLTVDVKHFDKSGKKVMVTTFSNVPFFDPGNGNGGGDRFP